MEPVTFDRLTMDRFSLSGAAALPGQTGGATHRAVSGTTDDTNGAQARIERPSQAALSLLALLAAGGSLRDMASTQGVALSELQGLITSVVEPQLNWAVQAGVLTRHQVQEILSHVGTSPTPSAPATYQPPAPPLTYRTDGSRTTLPLATSGSQLDATA